MSEQTTTKNPLELDDLLPKFILNPFRRPIKHCIEKALGISYLAKAYKQLNTNGKAENFIKKAFNRLDIDYQIVTGSVDNIPKTGPLLVVANHPYGAIYGMAMIDLLKNHRGDIKVIANGFLKRVPEISDVILSVNPYGHKKAIKENSAAMRECLRWLKKGGLIFMFPAGDVSSLNMSKLSISDAKWDAKVIRLANKTGASIVPLHIDGRNSIAFYLAGVMHPMLKTLLPRQIIKQQGRAIQLKLVLVKL
jgi:putative hemolysin